MSEVRYISYNDHVDGEETPHSDDPNQEFKYAVVGDHDHDKPRIWSKSSAASLRHRFSNRVLDLWIDLGDFKLSGKEVDQWNSSRRSHALTELGKVVRAHPDIHDGYPVLIGTRVAVSQILAEIADDKNLSEIVAIYDLDLEDVRKMFEGLAMYFDRPA